jgi:hypothetical protein
MKKIFLLSLFVIVFFGTIFLLPNIKEKTFASSRFETIMEMKKEYQFVQILNIPESSELTDCYGQSLYKFGWYVHSTNGKSFCPVNNDYSESDYENADVPGELSAFKAKGQVSSDTVSFHGIEVKMLVFGKRFIYAGFNGQGLTYWLSDKSIHDDADRIQITAKADSIFNTIN